MTINKLRKEIEGYFALKTGYGAYEIENLETDNRAWVLLSNSEYGVFFEYAGEEINETFSGVRLKSDIKILEDEGTINVLVLSCGEKELRNEFSLICENFVDTGEDGNHRMQIARNPLSWWKRWCELLGNVQGNKMVYDIVGELYSVLKLCETNKKPFWSATGLSSHDIETETDSFEVKSTLNKEKRSIHVSSQFQLSADKPLYLIFTRLEASENGKSIDDILYEISKYQPDKTVSYNKYLEEKGYSKGNHSRKKKFVILERRKYSIDEAFPSITEDSFCNGKIPDNIMHIEYDVSLDGLDFENWK